MSRLASAMATAGLPLAACGSSKTDRGASGAGIGAAAGGGAAAVTGGRPLTGAMLGGAAGVLAATTAMTTTTPVGPRGLLGAPRSFVQRKTCRRGVVLVDRRRRRPASGAAPVKPVRIA